MSETAIFGGTFDPVHIGHMKMAEYAFNNYNLEKIVFVPNGNPPHKRDRRITEAFHRYNMLKIAVSPYKNFFVSDYEIKKKSFSYSLDTMRYFRSIYGEKTFFIMGADSLCTIHLWYEYKKLLAENRFLVFFRSSENDGIFFDCVDRYRRGGADITVAHMPKAEVSSTSIRNKISAGVCPKSELAPEVYEYICRNDLYGD